MMNGYQSSSEIGRRVSEKSVWLELGECGAVQLRYAHLASDQPREAVARLSEKPVLALTIRLKWESFSAASGYWTTHVVSGPQQHFGLRL
jgi:hypothetical protein